MAAPSSYTKAYGDAIESRFVALGQPIYDPDVDPPDPPDPPTYPPPVADPAVQAQIARETDIFKVIGTMIATGAPLFTIPYDFDLGNGHAWISGDKSGYQKIYDFLVYKAGAFAHGRASFWVITDDAGKYVAKLNDKYMDEIQTTGIGYDGKIAVPPFNTQEQAPGYEAESGVVDDGPSNPPTIHYHNPAGVIIETRDYTALPLPTTVRITDLGLTDWVKETGKPKKDNNGFGNAPHDVFYSHELRVRFQVSGKWQRMVGIEYASFRPDYKMSFS